MRATIPALLILSGCDAGLAACEEAIKDTLKAPSTYERIDHSRTGPYYRIEYDAKNSFGTPLRSSGLCEYEHGQASWTPF